VQEAETQSDPKVQKQFLELMRRWLLLARGLTDSGPHTGALNGDQRGCSGGRVRRRPTATTRRREATLISMHDQPQPACSSVEHNSTQRADADYYRPQKKGFEKRSFWIGCKHLPSSLWRGGGGFGLDARASVISSFRPSCAAWSQLPDLRSVLFRLPNNSGPAVAVDKLRSFA